MKLRCTWKEGFEPRFKAGDAGIDMRAYLYETEAIEPGKVTEIPTGLRVEFPEGYCGLVVPRSSTGREGLEIANKIPLIDPSFVGEIAIYVTSRVPMLIEPQERFAQLILVPYYQVSELEYGEPRETERGDNSFGSSGRY